MTVAITDFKDGFTFTGASTTQGPFTLIGGRYRVSVAATWGGGSATLNMLLPDGSTYQSAGSTTAFTANGSVVVDLPPGAYQVAIATATAVEFALIRVPYRA